MSSHLRYYLSHKPYGMLSQFTRESGHTSLADLPCTFPRDVYPVGRLDAESEGLLILTNDKTLNKRILLPGLKLPKTYLVLLDGNPDLQKQDHFKKEMNISIDGKSHTCKFERIRFLEDTPAVSNVNLPIRERDPSKLRWIEVVLTEGKNRQIRRMTGSLGFPSLRVIRTGIGNMKLDGLLPGDVMELEGPELRRLLGISK